MSDRCFHGLLFLPPLLIALLIGCSPTTDSVPVVAVGASTPLEAISPAVEKILGMPVQLNIHELRNNNEWTFLTATPLTADGKAIDYSSTIYAEDIREGYFDDWLCALVQKSDGGKWYVVALDIGATDAPFVDWPDRYGVPKALVVPE